MPKLESKQRSPFFWHYDSECFEDISENVFTSDFWRKQDAISGQEAGRGTTWFIQHGENSLVLRHYLRGGLMSKLSKDHYWFQNWSLCRSLSEFTILNQLHQQGLPVPKPAAAQVIKTGLTYQADLLTHRIPDAQDLVQVLREPKKEEFYTDLGALIAKFHQAGVYHADLNIQNILWDAAGQFWLIDFDRAKIKKPNKNWQENNLKRLKRSFEKEVERHQIKWQIKDWQSLIEGYEQARQQSS